MKRAHHRSRIILAAGLLTAAMATLPMAASADFTISHWTIAGGGTMEASGGNWTLAGTIGQWEATEARALSGGQWRLTGGFWGFTLEELADFLFYDRFEQKGQTEINGNSVELDSSS